MSQYEQDDLLEHFSTYIEILSWILVGIGCLIVVEIPLPPPNRQGMYVLVVVAALYTGAYYHILVHQAQRWRWVRYVPAIAAIPFLGGVSYFTDSRVEIEVVYVLVVSLAGIRHGRIMAIVTAGLCTVADFVDLLLSPAPSFVWTTRVVNLLIYLSAGYLSAVMGDALHRQTGRMAVLNEVARALSSTIEMDELLELIYQQLSRIISTDTYYVGLCEPSSAFIEIQMVVDGGQHFPKQKIPLGEGLASLVVQNQQPLLLNHLSAEQKALTIKRLVVGSVRRSESWLGVPLPMSDGFTGVLVVASYRANAFGEDDITLLSNIAGQVALMLDNARHHAQMKDQARRDSLTGVYNHGYLLTQLKDETARSGPENPVALIMLDVDHFKQYNDTYGHVVGDHVLMLIVKAIQAHVKSTDTIARWGGEEFGIILPNATRAQARLIADRIRATLLTLPLTDEAGHSLPKPTVSQGIATFPDCASDANQLVGVADGALYTAKHEGRDQVRVAGSEGCPALEPLEVVRASIITTG